MSIVTRGLSAPQGLIATHGLGAATVLIIIPLVQSVGFTEILVTAGFTDHEMTSFVTNRNQLVVAVEYETAIEVLTPAQLSEFDELGLDVSIVEISLSSEVLTPEIVNEIVDEEC